MNTPTACLVITMMSGFWVASGQQSEDTRQKSERTVFSDPAGKHYFPAQKESFNRYTQYLHAMGEPSLFALAKDKDAEAYRFLYLPTFSKPIAYRAYRKDKQYRMHITRLNGKGGYDAGCTELTGDIELEQVDFESIRDIVQHEEVRSPMTKRQADAFAALGGAEWILEIAHKAEYYLVSVQCPDLFVDPPPELSKRWEAFAKELGTEPPNQIALTIYVNACSMFYGLAEVPLPQR